MLQTNITKLLIIIFIIYQNDLIQCYSSTSSKLSVKVENATCSNEYSIYIQSVSFDCMNQQCDFGSKAFISSSLKFNDISSLDLYIVTSLDCETWYSKTSTNSNDNIKEALTYTEYLPLCANNDDTTNEACSYESGSFQWSYNYSIPSPSSTYTSNEDNEDGAGYNISTRLLFYAAEDMNTIVGDCNIKFTANNNNGWFYRYYNNYNTMDGSNSNNALVDDNSIKIWYTKVALCACLSVLIVAAALIISRSLPNNHRFKDSDEDVCSYELS